ncbi:MAG: DUF1700 domain-containing protein [Christensenellaceae bacterium]|nr:DUF1700 domain-containing protein [Christensenellaceae bacterium]
MNREQFLREVGGRLKGLPREDLERSLEYYNEMISDHIENGLSEEEAVAAMGSIEDVVSQILSEIPLKKIVKGKTKSKKRLKAWEIVLLILGFPVWGSIMISLLAVIFSVYVSLWAGVISLWATDLSLAVSGLGMIAGGIFALAAGGRSEGLVIVGVGFVLSGLAALFFFVCKYASVGMAKLGKVIVLWIKRMFIGKGEKA